MSCFNYCRSSCNPCCVPCCEPCCRPNCGSYYPSCCICPTNPCCSNFSIITNPAPVVTTAIQAQLQDSSQGNVLNGANVVFDTVLLNTSSEITYDNTTGVFTINAPGRYLVNWWVNADGAGIATNIVFSAVSGATSISASSPSGVTTLQLDGQGLFDVGSVPATLSLVNNTGDTVFLAASLVQADIVIQKL